MIHGKGGKRREIKKVSNEAFHDHSHLVLVDRLPDVGEEVSEDDGEKACHQNDDHGLVHLDGRQNADLAGPVAGLILDFPT